MSSNMKVVIFYQTLYTNFVRICIGQFSWLTYVV